MIKRLTILLLSLLILSGNAIAANTEVVSHLWVHNLTTLNGGGDQCVMYAQNVYITDEVTITCNKGSVSGEVTDIIIMPRGYAISLIYDGKKEFFFSDTNELSKNKRLSL